MIRQEVFDTAKIQKRFLEVMSMPVQFSSLRKAIDSHKDWTEEEKNYLKIFVDIEEWLNTLASSANKSDWTEEEKKAALSIEKEIRRKMDSLR